MRTMILSDLLSMRSALAQMALIWIAVCAFICIGTQSIIAGVGALTSMGPIMYLFNIVAYDEVGEWQCFRLTLPISRHQVVWGRYASVLLISVASAVLAILIALAVYGVAQLFPLTGGAAEMVEGFDAVANAGYVLVIAGFMLVMSALMLPFLMRFGVTKGSRLLPLLLVLIMVGGLFLIGNTEVLTTWVPALDALVEQLVADPVLSFLVCAAAFVVALVPYAASALITLRLYEHRSF